MVGKKGSAKYLKFFIYLVVIVLVNVAGITLFYRMDLTASKIYSISAASKRVVATLSEPLTINVFFTRNLPPPHNNTERYLHDLLAEYSVYAGKFFNYRFYDVSPDEGEITDETQENQKLANNYGIHPIQIQAVEKDEVKFQRAYMGLVLIHGDVIERIPTITSTDGLEYSLTTAIRKMNNKISALLSLADKINVKLFLSSSLETVAPHMGVRNLANIPVEIETIVKKLNQKNYGKLEFEFLNPSQDKDIDAIANKYNIMTLSWPNLAKGKISAGKGAIGLVMEYADKSLTVPLLQVIQLPIIGTQYKLAEMAQMEEVINNNIERLIDINEDLGYLADHGTLTLTAAPPSSPIQPQNQDAATNFRTLISQNYTLKNVSLKDKAIPESLNCLVIARPTEKFSNYELFQIDQFLMQGKSLALVLDRFNEVMPADQQGMNLGRAPVYLPLDTGLEKLLAHYGIRIQQSFVMDENCFRQQMPAHLGGGDRAIYFAPMIKNRFISNDLEFMRNIKALVALKISPIELLTERISQNALKSHRLFSSSEKSWEMRDRINLNPMFIQPPPSSDDMQSYPLAYILEGEFPSYFTDKPLPVKEVAQKEEPDQETKTPPADNQGEIDLSQIKRQGQFMPKGKPGKIFVMASADMLRNNVLDAGGKGSNALFIMNVVDYLNGREDIAVMRGKQQLFNPLEDTGAVTKTFTKAFNIAGLPVLVVLFGLGVWFRRHSRKKHIQMMFDK
ncbi:MAG: ABC transporter permease [Desulfobacterales bacterium]|nr:ABC transporter permease [Desulfobacterales bacterium]